MENELIEYYVSEDALDGIHDDNPHQYDTKTALLIKIVEVLQWDDDRPLVISKALVEDVETGEFHLVPCELLKRHVIANQGELI